MPETTENWAARTAPKLDAEGWRQSERDARFPDHGYHTNDQRWHGYQARALLAHRSALVDGLSAEEREALAGRTGHVPSRLFEIGLAEQVEGENEGGLAFYNILTRLGREANRILEVRHGR